MDATSILERLTPLFRDVFDDDELVATTGLTAQRVSGWDSLGNVRLFLEIEKEFSVRFSATEITSLKNVGQLADLIETKIKVCDLRKE
jgi:acyl carrier protein